MKRTVILALAFWFLLAVVVPITFGQTIPVPVGTSVTVVAVPKAKADNPPPTPAIPGWVFSVSGGYSNVTNAPTNNGFAAVTELKLVDALGPGHLVVRGDVFMVTNPNVTGSYIGPQYVIPASKMFSTNTNNPINAGNVEFFVNVKLGDIRSNDPKGSPQAKFSWGIGGGFNVQLSDHTFIRPLDVSYIRGSVFQNGGTVIGNHLQAAALLGVRF